MSLYVKDFMINHVVHIEATSTVKNAARMMNKFGASSLIVTYCGDIVGIVTGRDIVVRIVASCQDPEEVTVRDIMSEPIIVVSSDIPLEQAVKIMLNERIKQIPVVDQESELIGILSMTEVARLQPHLMDKINLLMASEATMDQMSYYIR
jgi:CBS-domain-containing membrane protein